MSASPVFLQLIEHVHLTGNQWHKHLKQTCNWRHKVRKPQSNLHLKIEELQL